MIKRIPPVYLSLAVILILAVWMMSGSISGSNQAAISTKPTEKATAPLMKVQVIHSTAKLITQDIVMQGQLEPKRMVKLRAETAGRIASIKATKGQRVNKGELLLQLSMDDRKERLAQTEARLNQYEDDLKAVSSLKREGYSAQSKISEALAQVATAKADLKRINLEIENTFIRAPFDGVINDRSVEQGDFVDRGDALATVIDDSTILVTAPVPQQNIASITLGQPATAQLITGNNLQGKVTYLSSVADEQTRTYRVEVEVDNANQKLSAGTSATLRIPAAESRAHFISPAVLSLLDTGTLGVKVIDKDNRVVFHPVSVVRTQTDGIWVAGPPDDTSLITLGQGFVNAGDIVDPVLQNKPETHL